METEKNQHNENKEQIQPDAMLQLYCVSLLSEMLWNTPTAVLTVGQKETEGPDYQERAITPIDVSAAMCAPICNPYAIADAPKPIKEMIRAMWHGNPYASLDDIFAHEDSRLVFFGLNYLDSANEPTKGGAWYLYYKI